MIKKTLRKDGKMSVGFYTEPMPDAEAVHLVGSFNGWDVEEHAMRQLKDGRYSAWRILDRDARYEFRYLVNGERWLNDSQADEYVPNPHGSDNCVVCT